MTITQRIRYKPCSQVIPVAYQYVVWPRLRRYKKWRKWSSPIASLSPVLNLFSPVSKVSLLHRLGFTNIPGQNPNVMEMLTNPKKTFVCQYCGRPFRRLEHVQRHERIHTNETPFKCICGKCFSRRYVVSVKLSTSILILTSRDLLQRHEKGAHNDEWSRHLRRDDPSGQI